MSPELYHEIVAEMALAPSVHNVQPARWRFSGDHVSLFEDTSRRVPACDPGRRDTGVSLGAAIEGLSLALSARGFALEDADEDTMAPPDMRFVCRFRVVEGGQTDPLHPFVDRRYSHRGGFAKPMADDRLAAEGLTATDCAVVSAPDALRTVAGHYDRASLRFFRDAEFRAELVSWMRLDPRHPRWALDGLNAEAMALSRIEAMGAGMVLGERAFPLLDRVGLAGPLTAEAPKVTGAAAVVVLHRPDGEDHLTTGRAFYRAWLRAVAAGFQGAIMAALADDEAARSALTAMAGIPSGHRVVTALRIGRTQAQPPIRARLPIEDTLV
jgi:hypothetical protein